MDLVGWALPSVLGVLAFALFLALAAGFPRPRQRWWNAPLRAVMLVCLNVLVLCIAAALLNNQYSFYTSWSDLAGGSAPAKTEHFGGSDAAALTPLAGASLTATPPHALPRLPQPGKRLQRFHVVGKRSHFANEVLVRLPEHYNPASGRKYPVIVALHGFPGHPRVFGRLAGFFSDLDEAARLHHMSEAIVVMPLINHPSTLDTECVDAPGGPKAETWLSVDIPEWVMTHFSAKSGRQSWVAYGYSFGGWCAAMLGMKHPDVFGAAVVFQGYFRPEFDKGFEPFKPGSSQYAAYDLVAKARHEPPPLAMWVLASQQDKVSYQPTKEFIDAARAPLSVTAVMPKWGGHRTTVWADRIPETFSWVARTLSGFRA